MEGIEKALNQNSLFWMVNGDAELEKTENSPHSLHAPGTEMKDICLQTIHDIVQNVSPSDTANPTPAPAALQLLQQFDMLEQQNMRTISLQAVEGLASSSRTGEESAMKQVKQTAEIGFFSDADNIVMQNAQAEILDRLHVRLRQLENRQRELLCVVSNDFDSRRREIRHEVKYLLPHMRGTEESIAGNATAASDLEEVWREELQNVAQDCTSMLNKNATSGTSIKSFNERFAASLKGPTFFTDEEKAILKIGRLDLSSEDVETREEASRLAQGYHNNNRPSDSDSDAELPAWYAKIPWIIFALAIALKSIPRARLVHLASRAHRAAAPCRSWCCWAHC